MTTPKVFISYTWEDSEHKTWVKEFATCLRKSGIESILDQWELVPGDQLTVFMERSIRQSDYVIIICTSKYKEKSNFRTGGVGYEGDIMTAEIATGADRRKFIPLLRKGNWDLAAPSWLKGSYYIDFSDDDCLSGESYNQLVKILLGQNEKIPEISKKKLKKSNNHNNENHNDFDIPSPVEAYMLVRASQFLNKSKFPIAVNPKKVGWYPALVKSGAGYFYDDVLEYRVWLHPYANAPMITNGGDYYCSFPTYESALEFSKTIEGAEEPLVLIRQKEHINEPKPGMYEHIKEERITEWQVDWLNGSKRNPESITNFLTQKTKEHGSTKKSMETNNKALKIRI